MKKYIILFVICLTFLVGCNNAFSRPNDNKPKKEYSFEILSGKHHVEIKMKKLGKIELELDADIAPVTTSNFINLASNKFYDGLTFHRIMEGFMIQGGDPEGNGYGGSGEEIEGEFSANGYTKNTISHVRGVISMGRSSNSMDSASSQFFICNTDSTFLDGQYAAFGRVTKGLDVVDKITNYSKYATDTNGTIPKNKQPVIEYIKVID